jgi:hypothetical protein
VVPPVTVEAYQWTGSNFLDLVALNRKACWMDRIDGLHVRAPDGHLYRLAVGQWLFVVAGSIVGAGALDL